MIVDLASRSVTGLAVPWGQVGERNGRRYLFVRGALTWHGRIRLCVQHDPATVIGRAVELADTVAGLHTVLSVASGKAGDRALSMAAAGTWRGLSVGVDDDATYQLDGDIWRCTSARLIEISLTPTPAFEVA